MAHALSTFAWPHPAGHQRCMLFPDPVASAPVGWCLVYLDAAFKVTTGAACGVEYVCTHGATLKLCAGPATLFLLKFVKTIPVARPSIGIRAPQKPLVQGP